MMLVCYVPKAIKVNKKNQMIAVVCDCSSVDNKQAVGSTCFCCGCTFPILTHTYTHLRTYTHTYMHAQLLACSHTHTNTHTYLLCVLVFLVRFSDSSSFSPSSPSSSSSFSPPPPSIFLHSLTGALVGACTGETFTYVALYFLLFPISSHMKSISSFWIGLFTNYFLSYHLHLYLGLPIFDFSFSGENG